MNNAAYLLRLRKRLAAKTSTGPGCWEWLGLKDKDGYAVIYSRETTRVSRLIWSLSNGTIADGMLVLHRCDNPACVRLDHLFLGTHADNVRDKMKKGRWRGNPIKRVRLTCQSCNKTYEVHLCRKTSKFCSGSCRATYYNQRGQLGWTLYWRAK